MKMLLAGMTAVLMLMGAGCTDNLPLVGGEDTVEGKWRIAFELPEGWAMLKDYDLPRNEAVTPSEEVTRDLTDVYIQNTTKAVVTGGIQPEAEVPADTYVTDGFVQIHAFRLDERRVIPSESEDLGDGWYRLKLCEAGEDCTIYGQYHYDYYLVSSSGAKYKFNIVTRGVDPQQAIDVIMTAQEVTTFTDEPTIDAEVTTE